MKFFEKWWLFATTGAPHRALVTDAHTGAHGSRTNHCKSQITNGRGDTEYREMSRRDFSTHKCGAPSLSAPVPLRDDDLQSAAGPVRRSLSLESIGTYREGPSFATEGPPPSQGAGATGIV